MRPFCTGAALLLIALAFLAGCGDSIERDIERLAEGGQAAEKARTRLNRARLIDTRDLIRGFRNIDYPARTRVDIAEALYQLYRREEDRRVLNVMVEGLEDRDAAVRTKAARILKEMGQPQTMRPLINRLVSEGNETTRYAILDALEALSRANGALPFSSELRTDQLKAPEKMRFTQALVQLTRKELPDSIRQKTGEWLEILAAEKATEALEWAQKGDPKWAEKLLLEARGLIPDSKNINWQLGRFYWDHNQADKGRRILAEAGVLARAHQLRTRPQIDGVLKEPAWQNVTPLTRFYQCTWNLRPSPAAGKTEIYLGHLDNDLYIGVRAHEPSTENLAATAIERDDPNISRDDCIELFLDTDHDYQTYYHIIVNSIGTITDQYNDGSSRTGNLDWDGVSALATRMEGTSWTVELLIPGHRFKTNRIRYNDAWGFNLARVRVAHSSEYSQWVPTYGSAHRPDRFGFLLFE